MALLLVYSGKLGGYNATKETCVPWFKPPPSSNFGGKKPAGFIY